MNQYYMVFIWLALVGIVSAGINSKQIEIVNGRKEVRYNRIWASIIILPLIYWAGTRTYAFFDTGSYAQGFSGMPATFSGIPSFLTDVNKDKGFYLLSSLIRVIVGDNPTFYFTILAIIQAFLLFSILRKYSCNYMASVFLFVASTDYLSWMHNGIRQFTAVTIIFFATKLMLEKKYIRMILVIIFASFFHQSALLMIPIVFITQGKAWNASTILIILAALIAIVYVDQFTQILDQLLVDTQYTNVVSDWQSWQDNGTNPIRVLVYSIPTILSIIGYKYIKVEEDAVINMCVNMSIVSTGLYLVSMFTSGIFIGRLPIYVSLYANCILLPWEIEHIFEAKSSRIVYGLMVIAYLLFYYYQVHLVWGMV